MSFASIKACKIRGNGFGTILLCPEVNASIILLKELLVK